MCVVVGKDSCGVSLGQPRALHKSLSITGFLSVLLLAMSHSKCDLLSFFVSSETTGHRSRTFIKSSLEVYWMLGISNKQLF